MNFTLRPSQPEAKTAVGPRRKFFAWVAGFAASAAVAIAVHRFTDGRAAELQLAAVRQQQLELEKRVSETEEKLLRAQRFAAEAEQDRRDLLRALDSIRTQRRSPTPPPPSVAAGQEEEQRNHAEEEQFLVAAERDYAQATARKRKDEVVERAKFEELLIPLRDDPEAKFNQRIQTAALYAARGAFQRGIRVFNEAMAEKPPQLPLSEQVLSLQAMLRAQNAPREVTLASDGQTFVAVIGVRLLGTFSEKVVQVLPDNYEVIGRRSGYRDVVLPLRVRNGEPAPVLSVVCTQPVER